MKYIICPRCSGHGVIASYHHVEGGRCFQCEGAGKILVEDNVKDTIKEIREDRKRDKEVEKEYWTLLEQYNIKRNDKWYDYIENSKATEIITEYEERLIRINQYITYKKDWKEFINKHQDYINLDVEEFLKIKNDFENKYMNR